MKKFINTIIIVTVTLLAAYIITAVAGIRVIIHDDITVTKNIHRYIEDRFNKKVIITEDNNTDTLSYKDVGIDAKIDNTIEKYINTNVFIYANKIKVDYSFDGCKDYITKINNNRSNDTEAYITKTDGHFKVMEASKGNSLDANKLLEYIEENVGNDIQISLADFYNSNKDIGSLRDKLDSEINKLNNTYVEYSNGYKLSMNDLYEYTTVSDNSIVLDSKLKEEYTEYIDNKLEQNLIDYDTVGNTKTFKTTQGDIIDITGGTWGNFFSSDKETEYVIDLFSNKLNETNRVPIMDVSLGDEIPSTYVEVSIDNQHLWYYKDGILYMESPVVTGALGRHDTPKGVYYVSECINGKYLTGETYRTWVNKWMRLTNSGIGLHDAGWRGTFGSDIYTYNGSHGCINLPLDFAYKLYKEINTKDCVIIY